MERDFKGIWIPKEIWLSKDLTIMEKLFLVEINSLDNKDGCFASNSYFADFFGISKGRCTQIIKSLEGKGQVSVEIQREGKNITKRVVRILNTLVRKLNTPLSKTKHPYLENDEDNNTVISNTNNILLFESFWKLYPRKKGDKKKIMEKYSLLASEHTAIMEGLSGYVKECNFKKRETQYILHPATFLNGRRWEDEFEIPQERKKGGYDIFNIKQ